MRLENALLHLTHLKTFRLVVWHWVNDELYEDQVSVKRLMEVLNQRCPSRYLEEIVLPHP